MVTNYFWSILADVKIDHLHSLLWCSETECTVLYMHDLIAPLMPLYRVVSAENRLINGNCASTRIQSEDRHSFVTLAFLNELDIGILISVYLPVISSLHCVKFW